MTASPPSADQSADIDPAVVEYAVPRRWGKPSARQTVAILLCGLILAAGLSLAVHFVDALTAVPSQPDYGVPPIMIRDRIWRPVDRRLAWNRRP